MHYSSSGNILLTGLREWQPSWGICIASQGYRERHILGKDCFAEGTRSCESLAGEFKVCIGTAPGQLWEYLLSNHWQKAFRFAATSIISLCWRAGAEARVLRSSRWQTRYFGGGRKGSSFPYMGSRQPQWKSDKVLSSCRPNTCNFGTWRHFISSGSVVSGLCDTFSSGMETNMLTCIRYHKVSQSCSSEGLCCAINYWCVSKKRLEVLAWYILGMTCFRTMVRSYPALNSFATLPVSRSVLRRRWSSLLLHAIGGLRSKEKLEEAVMLSGTTSIRYKRSHIL